MLPLPFQKSNCASRSVFYSHIIASHGTTSLAGDIKQTVSVQEKGDVKSWCSILSHSVIYQCRLQIQENPPHTYTAGPVCWSEWTDYIVPLAVKVCGMYHSNEWHMPHTLPARARYLTQNHLVSSGRCENNKHNISVFIPLKTLGTDVIMSIVI